MSVERLIPEVLLDETTGAGAITVVTSGPFSKFMRSFLTDKEQQRMIKALVKRSVDGTTGESSMRADDEGDFSECHSQYVARAKRNLEQARKMQEIALAEVGVAEKELAIAQNKFEMIREKLQTTLQAGKLYRRVLEIDKLEAELQNVRERLSACKKRRKPEQVQSEDTQAEASIDEPKSKMPAMKKINCSGTPSSIGFQHGKIAKVEIDRGLIFYREMFHQTSGLSWSEVCDTAAKFEPVLQKKWPQYCEEMHGIASGAGVSYLSILALNVRTEIAYGMSKDGCTVLFWRNEHSAFLAQNWDWEEEHQENLINLSISQESKPSINMITEAGIIGKIGLNSSGVGVCLNAIQALGVDFGRLPCHLALRTCLESESVAQAVATLQKVGVASACHIFVADAHEAVGLECTSIDIVELPTKDVLTHTNHLLKLHPNVEDKMAMQDSPARLERIDKLLQQARFEAQGPLLAETIRSLLADEDNSPTAICRERTQKSSVATLFSIIMDLRKPGAEVTMGRPSNSGETLYIDPRE